MSLPDWLVSKMHADYMSGASLAALGRAYNRDRRTVREIFERRGLHVRPLSQKPVTRLPNGQIAAYVPKTPQQIEALIKASLKISVPVELKLEWRKWTIAQRGAFIKRLRDHLQLPTDRPTTPFSDNLQPFDYASPIAHRICAKLNHGRDSRNAVIKLDACTQGVIYEGQLWFWSFKVGYQFGKWTPETGRPVLHRHIWEQANGPIPAKHCISYRDGNRNNLSPDNLELISMDENCRRNQAAALNKKSRALTALLLNRSQNTEHTHTDAIQHLKGL